jgi:hypothetical protein
MPIRRLIKLAIATVIGAGAAQAQQREATLQRVEVANAGFDIVIATAKPGSPPVDYRGLPDPNLVYLPSGDLVYAYTASRPDLAEEAIFMPPTCSFHVDRADYSARTPVVIYVIPKGMTPPRTRQPGSQ